jgi:hypothetical protein
MNDLRVQYSGVGGTIPDEIWGLDQVYRIDLFKMNLTGTLSPLVSQMDRLGSLRLHGNELSGQIPTELGLLSNLQRLRLEENRFSGAIPSALCELRGPEGLFQVTADCLNSTVGDESVVCECCDICCSRELGECVDFPADF